MPSKKPPPSGSTSEQIRESMSRSREESQRRHHDRQLRDQQARAALDKEALSPSQAALQLRAFAEMWPGQRANTGEEIGGSIIVKMARLGAFAAYPEAQRLLIAHAAKPPTVSRVGAWMDAVGAIRKQRGLKWENPFETYGEDAAFVAGLIETDPALAKLPGACMKRTDQAAIVVAAADAVFEAWAAVCVYAGRDRQYNDIGVQKAGKDLLLERFHGRAEAADVAMQAIDKALLAIPTVDAALEAVTGEKPRAILSKAKPALMELKSIVGLSSPLDKRYATLMEEVATAQRVVRGLDIVEQRSSTETGFSKPSHGGRGQLEHTGSNTSPQTNATEDCVVQALREAGQRLTGEVLLNKALGKADSHGKAILAGLVRRNVITNKRDVKPPGYGLPEWP